MTLLHQAAQKAVEAALRRAFDLGQLYWQQADSDSYKQNAKADITQAKFDALVAEAIAALQHQEVPREPVAWLNPSSGKTCSADEKFSMENHQGMPGKAVAAHFSDPLYASPSTTRQQEVGSEALGYATRLACSMWGTHYRDDAPDWRPLPNLMGVLTQIDNMTAGLAKKQEVGSGYEKVGYFIEDSGRWLKMDDIYADDPDAVVLFRIAAAPSTPENAGGVEGKCECGLSEAACRDPLRRSCPDGVQEVHRG